MKKLSTPLQNKDIRVCRRGKIRSENRAPVDACDVNTGPGAAHSAKE